MLACTPLGWGPKQPSESVAHLPACKPNVCPNLLNKRINQGGWECRKQNTTKRCKNHRTGELCLLKCQENFKVLRHDTRDYNTPFLKAAFGHVSVCTEEGWLPRAEDLRCYGWGISMALQKLKPFISVVRYPPTLHMGDGTVTSRRVGPLSVF